MVNATNVSQKECEGPIMMGGRALSEDEIQECLSKGGIILSSGTMAMPMSEEEVIKSKFHVRAANVEERFIETIRRIKSGGYTEEDILFVIKEGRLNVRTAYGMYLSICAEKQVEKVITWRTFYMQCNGYRTIKPNTMESVVRLIKAMLGKSVKLQ